MSKSPSDPGCFFPRMAKILEIGPFPPPQAGWAVRIEYVKERIEGMGHKCTVLNIGQSRRISSERYITVHNGLDYVIKTIWYSFCGYSIHIHTNGDVWPTGWALALIAEMIGFLFTRRAVLTFHAGTHQVYFPRERSGQFFPILYLLFKLPRAIICNNNAMKKKIEEYGISANKIFPISAFSPQYIESGDVSLPDHVESFIRAHDPIVATYVFLRDGFHIETLIDGIRLIHQRWPRLGVINAGSLSDSDEAVRIQTLQRLKDTGLADHVCFAGDLSHGQFLTLLRRSKLYLRTPTTDGESASVTESLSLGIPVVAAENGNRPPNVETYQATDVADLCEKVHTVLSNWETYCRRIVKPELRDTIQDEADLLINCALSGRALNALTQSETIPLK